MSNELFLCFNAVVCGIILNNWLVCDILFIDG